MWTLIHVLNRLTLHEEEERESWHAASNNILEKLQASPQASWADNAGDLIKAATKVVKVSSGFFNHEM
jgi:hypothetical protein